MSPSIWQIIIVAIIILLLFGPKRIPGIGKSLGEAIKGFKKGLGDDEIDVTDSAKREQIDQQTTTEDMSASQKSKQKDKV
jgi:sec-independent protein translocase protein TatA